MRPGEVVGLLGGNGAGKTTLIRVLLGLERASSGRASVFGAPPSLTTRHRIGYVAQGLGLYPTLSAIENLEFAASVHGIRVPAGARAAAAEFGRAPVGALPLGAKRRLAFLAAALHDPALLILDEPSSGMDALGRARLWELMREHADAGAGVLVTTHYMQEAAQCDRLVILTAGRVTATGTLAAITAAHTSLVVETPNWEGAFTLLRDAGIPVLLAGRLLRVPGVSRERVAAALAELPDRVTLHPAPATLAETMLLATREAARAGAS
ncbi:ABC transporter ATP-binding protein [Leucobacter luti]|uniref:ABC-2 type transport system ATP-binding protein n=1 Tax=Leucobacter luti TaxID=340320 RepID=A0A4Q7TLL4_9MICO|nr:ABC transporter ATP-binding protein [Leucobacter luti]RZT60588.1 ABC-2 type transport system ATP-binding protein [Leucobacter luti]